MYKFILSRKMSLFSAKQSASAFAHRSTKDLVFTLGIFKLCSYQSLVSFAPSLLSAADKIGLSTPILSLIKSTFFKQFCGGENATEIIPKMKELEDSKIKSILDLAVEQDLAKDLSLMSKEEIIETLQYDFEKSKHLAKEMKETIAIASASSGNCVALKFTCLVSPLFLKSFSSLLSKQPRSSNWFHDSYSSLACKLDGLSENETLAISNFDFSRSIKLLEELCDFAKEKSVKLMIDAEQTYFQPAIDYLALQLMLRYNTTDALLMNTYQMYLKDGLSRFKNDFSVFHQKGIYFGAKIVRGAYMKSERELAASLNKESPINDDIEATHSQYHEAIDFTHSMKNGKSFILFASHNQASIEHAASIFDKESKQICFAQLLGMNDYLSFTLANNGFKVFKYVPFGPVQEVVPYLLRRAIENSNVLNNASHDSFHIKNVLKDRFSFSSSAASFTNKPIA